MESDILQSFGLQAGPPGEEGGGLPRVGGRCRRAAAAGAGDPVPPGSQLCRGRRWLDGLGGQRRPRPPPGSPRRRLEKCSVPFYTRLWSTQDQSLALVFGDTAKLRLAPRNPTPHPPLGESGRLSRINKERQLEKIIPRLRRFASVPPPAPAPTPNPAASLCRPAHPSASPRGTPAPPPRRAPAASQHPKEPVMPETKSMIPGKWRGLNPNKYSIYLQL
ncbi:uncharacterized protein LOC130579603 [Malurus melanocephalus]|uniref:uncharacterized protein LOC130579603 n=1 Tax=Malurus melanocephalus TaxID=175006 RepID=UPI00254811C5|nr:uncharacterized protein LOC130579603 [Malurus melanocephalus]XP_057232513.1 uncharacterized protein LOC130579603 [Malurus melanocephalus]